MQKENFRILLVDDDPDEHFLFLSAIKQVNPNIIVTSVYNGVQALDFLLSDNKFKNNEQLMPNVILTDLNMPKLNGFELLNKIKNNQQLKHIPVFVMSTSAEQRTKELSLALGAFNYYSKPSLSSVYNEIIIDMLGVYVKRAKNVSI